MIEDDKRIAMLHFFRKIRRSLGTQNATRRYLLYALGEGTLVVLGIFIALQLNNWNETRKGRILEKTYLQRIIGDLEADIANLEEQFIKNKGKAQRGKYLDCI